MARLLVVFSIIAIAYEVTAAGLSEADAGEFPYQLSLRKDGEHICSAVLIDASYVLTTALCVHGLKEDRLTVAGGSRDLKTATQLSDVKTINEHDKFNTRTLENNLAMLELSTPIQQNPEAHLEYVYLPRVHNRPIATGSSVIVSGWGFSDSNNLGIADRLKKVSLVTQNPLDCHQTFGANMIKSDMICGIEDTLNFCQLDRGSPMVYSSNSQLVGLTSWGFGCQGEQFPEVYVDVGKHLDFICSFLPLQCYTIY